MSITVAGTSITFNDASTQSSAANIYYATGTAMVFYQASAPTGWTKATTHDNKAMRVVTGATGGGSGGTTAFTTVFTNQTPTINAAGLSAGATTLSTAQMPSHTHGFGGNGCGGGVPRVGTCGNGGAYGNNTGSAGSGNSHTHSISGSATSSAITLDVQYVDLIIATKN
jgi:hypothetical protein